jgi:ATP-dependent helicase HrpB
MAALPLHPRVAGLLVEAARLGVAADGCRAAAVLSTGERLPAGPAKHRGSSDVLALLEQEWSHGTRRVYEQVRRFVRGGVRSTVPGDEPFLMAVLKAFPDRVGKRRGGSAEILLAGGSAATLSESSVVNGEWMVAVDIEERRERGQPLVRVASRIQPEWLVDFFPERVVERTEVVWNRTAERVESVSMLLYDGLTIEESRTGRVDTEAGARLLAEKAIEAGLSRFADREELDAFLERVSFASRYAGLPAYDEAGLTEALAELCTGLRSFAELERAASNGGLVRAIESRLTPHQRKRLDQVAPARIRLHGGREVKVHYSRDKPPWAASRIQDFFGMRETPRVAGGEVRVVLHLLAPSQRPVQTTDDLAGFWKRLYPQVRRELGRRYPKHRWPEDPFAAH